METVFTTLLMGLACSFMAILAVGFVAVFLKRGVPAIFRELCEVRWRFVTLHSVLGFVVSCLVAPRLPAALAMAAGVTSTFIVAIVMHQLENIEVKTPARSRVRS